MDSRNIDMNIMMNPVISKRLVNELGTLYYSYNIIVEQSVREKYTVDDELSIQRQRDTKPEEFKEYNDFVESCKTKAKEIWARQEAAVQKIKEEYSI